jgi:hypothetical protein
MRTTRKLNKDVKDKCANTYCKKITKKITQTAKEVMSEIKKQMEDGFKKNPNMTSEQKKEYKQMKKRFEKMQSATTQKKTNKTLMDFCKLYNCNVDCKGTIMEKGDKLPAAITKKWRNNKSVLDLVSNNREKIFKGKNDVLKDGFYEGLSKVRVNKLKKEGAISNCSVI